MYTLDSLSHDQLAYLLFSPTFGNPQEMALQKPTQYTASSFLDRLENCPCPAREGVPDHGQSCI